MKTNPMQQMTYEIQQDHQLFFHHVMTDGNVIMAIRDPKTSWTSIVVSRRNFLKPNQQKYVLKVFKQKVLLIAFCGSQNMFAILFEDQLSIAILLENERIAYTNKRRYLADMNWWNEDMEFKTMLMQEIDKNVFVWFVDDSHYVRAFDVDTNDWDAAKV